MLKISPLSNKLKQIRIENNLSRPILADQFGISSTHIHYIENNKRGVSDDLLQKYSDFFQIPIDELKELKKTSVIVNNNSISKMEEDPNEIDNFLSLILSVEEPLRTNFINESKQRLQEMYLNLLTAFDLNELKKILTTIRKYWYTVEDSPCQENEYLGILKLPEQEIFFKMNFQEEVCVLDILYEDQRKIEYFSKWLTQPDCNITLQQKVPHLEELQKIKRYYWFSPNKSYKAQYQFLSQEYNELTNLNVQSYQLNLLIKHNQIEDIIY